MEEDQIVQGTSQSANAPSETGRRAGGQSAMEAVDNSSQINKTHNSKSQFTLLNTCVTTEQNHTYNNGAMHTLLINEYNTVRIPM